MSALQHKVGLDKTSGGYLRYTCSSDGCSEATLVRQPYMSDAVWKAESEAWLRKHPCRNIRSSLSTEEGKTLLTQS